MNSDGLPDPRAWLELLVLCRLPSGGLRVVFFSGEEDFADADFGAELLGAELFTELPCAGSFCLLLAFASCDSNIVEDRSSVIPSNALGLLFLGELKVLLRAFFGLEEAVRTGLSKDVLPV